MKDELSIITESLISDRSKLLYANKRRQLKGLAPMSTEEERVYLGIEEDPPDGYYTAFIHNRHGSTGDWFDAYRTAKPDITTHLAGRYNIETLVTELADAGYAPMYFNRKILHSLDSPRNYIKLSERDIEMYKLCEAKKKKT